MAKTRSIDNELNLMENNQFAFHFNELVMINRLLRHEIERRKHDNEGDTSISLLSLDQVEQVKIRWYQMLSHLDTKGNDSAIIKVEHQ